MSVQKSLMIVALVAVGGFMTSVSQAADSFSCGEPGHGKYRISPKTKTIEHVQTSLFGREKVTSITIDENRFSIQNCSNCITATGEFYAGDFVVLQIRTRLEAGHIVADIQENISTGESSTQTSVPCF